MSWRQVLSGVPRDKQTKITIMARDPDHKLEKLIDYLGKIGNTGHSFSIVVDPGDREHERKFGWDGDGVDAIVSVKSEEPQEAQ